MWVTSRGILLLRVPFFWYVTLRERMDVRIPTFRGLISKSHRRIWLPLDAALYPRKQNLESQTRENGNTRVYIPFYLFVTGKCLNTADEWKCNQETRKFFHVYISFGICPQPAVMMWEENWWLQQKVEMVRTHVYLTGHSLLTSNLICVQWRHSWTYN